MSVRETRALSTPIVLLDNVRIKILPNSLTVTDPGEAKGRAVSAGGGSVDLVYGFDASTEIATISFEVANTAEMVELKKDYAARRKRVQTSTLLVIEEGLQTSYDTVLMTKQSDTPYEVEGKIKLEFQGRELAV